MGRATPHGPALSTAQAARFAPQAGLLHHQAMAGIITIKGSDLVQAAAEAHEYPGAYLEVRAMSAANIERALAELPDPRARTFYDSVVKDLGREIGKELREKALASPKGTTQVVVDGAFEANPFMVVGDNLASLYNLDKKSGEVMRDHRKYQQGAYKYSGSNLQSHMSENLHSYVLALAGRMLELSPSSEKGFYAEARVPTAGETRIEFRVRVELPAKPKAQA